MKENDYSAIVLYLICRRKQKRYSQEKLARVLEVSLTTICNIEQMRMKPSLKLFIRMCTALDVSINLDIENEPLPYPTERIV